MKKAWAIFFAVASNVFLVSCAATPAHPDQTDSEGNFFVTVGEYNDVTIVKDPNTGVLYADSHISTSVIGGEEYSVVYGSDGKPATEETYQFKK